MRTFELVVVCLLSIQVMIELTGIKAKYNPLRYFPLLILLAICAQLLVEDYRWQLIPTYVLAIALLSILMLQQKSPKWLKVSRNLGLIFLLGLSMFLPVALPVLEFTAEGNFAVATVSGHYIDDEREEILTEDTDDYREIDLRMFYPTVGKHNEHVPYFPDWAAIQPTFDKKLGWPDFMIDYLRLFNLEARDGGDVVEEKFPLIIYSHGLTNNYSEASGRLLKLASHGYVVVAVNHTYSSDYAVLDNGKWVGYKPTTYLGDPLELIDSAKTVLADQWTHDVEFAIKKIRQSKISSSIDFERIGLIGFSAGGTMAIYAGSKLKEVKAIINLDGTPRGIQDYRQISAPVLMMYSEPPIFSDSQIKAWGLSREALEAPQKLIEQRTDSIMQYVEGSTVYRLKGTKHSNFIEYPLLSPFSSQLEIGGEVDSWNCYEEINTKIISFFRKNLY